MKNQEFSGISPFPVIIKVQTTSLSFLITFNVALLFSGLPSLTNNLSIFFNPRVIKSYSNLPIQHSLLLIYTLLLKVSFCVGNEK